MQYTIRQVPPQIDRLIRQQVKKSHTSLNGVLLSILEREVGAANEPIEYHDLDELAGTWVADPEFDAAMETFESIDGVCPTLQATQKTGNPHTYQ